MTSRENKPQRFAHEHFANAQLILCLVQVKFPQIARFADDQYVAGIKDALTETYPLSETGMVMNVTVGPQGITQAATKQLQFASLDRRLTVNLTDTAVSLETREYENIREFSGHFQAILQLVVAHLKVRHQLRFGLRYVNEFRHPEGQTYDTWQRMLNPARLNAELRSLLDGTVEQTITELRTRRSDGTLLIRHGFLSGTTVAPTPTRPQQTGPFYLIDLDYYDEFAQPFDPQAANDRMLRYEDALYQVFRWAIAEGEFYRYLRG